MIQPNADSWTGVIETISSKGFGVGTITLTHSGKTLRRPIFIPFTAPGDQIDATVTYRRGKYSFGEIKNIINPSLHRAVPLCPHFTVCGGCDLQHITYDEQLRQKAQQVAYIFKKNNIILTEENVRILGAKKHRHYRRRSKIALEFKNKKIVAGFRKYRSHDIVPITTCFIVDESIVQLIIILNAATTPIEEDCTFEILSVTGENKKLAILVPLDTLSDTTKKWVRLFFEELYATHRSLLGNLFFSERGESRTSGMVQEHLTYAASGMKFSFLPETFIQANIATNEILIATLLELLASCKAKNVLDLYAGIGNLSLPIAKLAAQVVAVEGYETSVLLGRINATQNNVHNIIFLHKSTEHYLNDHKRKASSSEKDDSKTTMQEKHEGQNTVPSEHMIPDTIILDPPRTGCTEQVISDLLLLRAKNIIYASCNPETLVRDIHLMNKTYKVEKIICIDMFPDTHHVETLVLLTTQ